MTRPSAPVRALASLLALCVSALPGCGGTLSSSAPLVSVRASPPVDGLTEAELQAMIDAEPALHDGYAIAWLAVAPGHEEALAATFAGLPGQTSEHRISPLVATGRRRFDEPSPGGTEVSLQSLRILAARAHAHVLVIVDHGWRSTRWPNGWAALSVLLLPSLFTPHIDAEVETYVETMVVDVRTGIILGETSTTDTLRVSNMTIWSNDDRDRADTQLDTLFADTRSRLATLLERTRRDAGAGREVTASVEASARE